VSGKKKHAYDIIPLRPTRPAWMLLAPCNQVDPDLWHDREQTLAAKKICNTCQFRAACLTYAVTWGEREGVWGGLSAPQRKELTEADLFGDSLDGKAA